MMLDIQQQNSLHSMTKVYVKFKPLNSVSIRMLYFSFHSTSSAGKVEVSFRLIFKWCAGMAWQSRELHHQLIARSISCCLTFVRCYPLPLVMTIKVKSRFIPREIQ